MPIDDRLFTAEQGAYMTGLKLSSFRTKVSNLGIKGTKQGHIVFYTQKQLEDVHSGIGVKALVDQKRKKPAEAKKSSKRMNK